MNYESITDSIPQTEHGNSKPKTKVQRFIDECDRLFAEGKLADRTPGNICTSIGLPASTGGANARARKHFTKLQQEQLRHQRLLQRLEKRQSVQQPEPRRKPSLTTVDKAALQNILKQMPKAVEEHREHLKKCGTVNTKFERLLKEAGRVVGIHDREQTLDYLDRYHPGWRGYEVRLVRFSTQQEAA